MRRATTRWPATTASCRRRCPRPSTTSPRRCTTRKARLAFLDEQGIQAQVLYPNVGGFGNGYFLRLGDRELVPSACGPTTTSSPTGAASIPDRLLAITALPFWDVDLAIEEMQRCVELGHRAVNFCNQPQDYGQPPLAHRHWDPIWAAAQEAGVLGELPRRRRLDGHAVRRHRRDRLDDELRQGLVASSSSTTCAASADLIFGGVCHRFPDLKFVSVESGVGWIPGALETFDWQWRNGGVRDEHPEYDLLPSEYFRRQIYGCFWFEQQVGARRDRAVPRQHPLRDRLPAPHLPAPRPAQPRRSGRATTPSALLVRTARRRRPARCCTTTPPRCTGLHERGPTIETPVAR